MVEVVRLGLVSYQEALQLQQVYVRRHLSGPAHALLLCQHPPVYTTGIRHQPYPAAVLDRLRLLGAGVHQTNRGGLITFHGPGQLVCYPILNLSSFKKVSSAFGGELFKGGGWKGADIGSLVERPLVCGSTGEDHHHCLQKVWDRGLHISSYWSLGGREQDLCHRYGNKLTPESVVTHLEAHLAD